MPIAAPVGAAIVTGIAGLAAGAVSSHATKKAAEAQTNAANHAADVEAQTANDQLAFAKQQAAIGQQNDQAAQMANYNQFAARQRDLSSLGAIIGLPPRSVAPPPTFASVAGDGSIGATAGITRPVPARRAPGGVNAAPAIAAPTFVTMRAPDGTHTQQIPADQVEHYTRLGAEVVN
jgi:hypothetical protein